MKMVRMGDWKLVFDMMGQGPLYNVARDPYELKNLWEASEAAPWRGRLLEELLKWTLRTQDDLPRAAYTTKRAAHGWYA